MTVRCPAGDNDNAKRFYILWAGYEWQNMHYYLSTRQRLT